MKGPNHSTRDVRFVELCIPGAGFVMLYLENPIPGCWMGGASRSGASEHFTVWHKICSERKGQDLLFCTSEDVCP